MTPSRILFSLAALGAAALLGVPAMAQGFKPSDLRGDFVFHFQGTLIQGETALPIAAVGVFTLDGEGKVTAATRFLNVAGVVVKQTATGTYTLEADGTGSATFAVVPAEGQPPIVPPTREVFQFTLTSRSRGWGVTGAIRGANGEDLGLQTIARTEFVKQTP